MDPATAESEIAYPSEAILAQGQSFLALSTAATQTMDSLWLNVKTTGSSSALIIGIIGLVAVIALCVVFLVLRKQKKAKRKNLYSK